MAESAYLASALVTGVLLLAVWVLVVRMENWRSYELAGPRSRESGSPLDSTAAWIAGFLLLVLVAGGGAVLVVSDAGFAAGVGSWVALVAVFAVLLFGFLLWGTYSSTRHRGFSSATAVLVSAWLFGSLVVAAIAAKLVLGL